MAIGASVTRGLGGGLLVLAGLVALGAVIAFLTGISWVSEAQDNGNDEQGQAGSDLVLGGAVAFGVAVVVGFLGGFLFFLGGALVRGYEARMDAGGAMPALPDAERDS